MSNKGFTLVELVVMIAVLAMISIISFISINEITNRGKIDNCNSLVNNIKNSAKEYVSDNRYKDTFDSDNNKIEQIDAEYLINDKYLKVNNDEKKIVNPFYTSEEISGSSIKIEIKLKNDYTVMEVNLYKHSISVANKLECVEEKWRMPF